MRLKRESGNNLPEWNPFNTYPPPPECKLNLLCILRWEGHWRPGERNVLGFHEDAKGNWLIS